MSRRDLVGGVVLMAAVSGCSLVLSTSDFVGGAGPDGGGTGEGGPVPGEPCAAAVGKAKFDFEGSEQGWTHGVSDNASGKWPFDPWTQGDDPLCPHGQCFGAERGKNYAQCQRGFLLSPKIDLASCRGRTVRLAFTHAHAFWSGDYNGATWFDGGIVEVSHDDGVSWQIPPASYPGTVRINPRRTAGLIFNCALENDFHVHEKPGFVGDQTMTTTVIEIPTGALTSQLRIRFSQASGVTTNTLDADQSRAGKKSGWRIDDVHLVLE